MHWLEGQLIRLAYWYSGLSRCLSSGSFAVSPVDARSLWNYGMRVCVRPVFEALESWRCLGVSCLSRVRVSRLRFVFMCRRIRLIADWPDCYLRLLEVLRLCVRATADGLRVFSHRVRRILAGYILPIIAFPCVEYGLSDDALPIRAIALIAPRQVIMSVLHRAYSDPGVYMRLSDR